MAKKLRLFIGSSTEALDYANAIQENLERDADCTVWTQGIFGLSRPIFTELLSKLSSFDCAVFVFSPDDKLVLRGEKKLAARDNVVFELGFFCGRVGEGRAFVVAPYDIKNLHLPTDLSGFTMATYRAKRDDGNIRAALGSACTQIRREIGGLTKAGAKDIPVIAKRGLFSDFTPIFPALFEKAKNVTLYFIHSRRWRENHDEQIKEFLGRSGTHLTVFLPNNRDPVLVKAIQAHFDDGPAIPGFVRDAFDYFKRLRKRFPKRVTIRRFRTYPTYSFYKFDNDLIVAAYPTTPRRRDVPTFHLTSSHPYAQFVLEDLIELNR